MEVKEGPVETMVSLSQSFINSFHMIGGDYDGASQPGGGHNRGGNSMVGDYPMNEASKE